MGKFTVDLDPATANIGVADVIQASANSFEN
jgi:hypothetical protein